QALIDGGCGVIEFSQTESVYNFKHVKRLKKLMTHYDIVHTHNTSPQLFAAMAKGKSKAKLVTTEHSTNNRRRSMWGYGCIDRWMYSRYDKIVCISDIAKEKLLEHIGSKYQQEVLTINNGVDVQRFYVADEAPDLRLPDCFVTVMVAGFREAKDQDTLIRAIASLPNQYQLWLVGDGVRRGALEAVIASEGVAHRVKLLGIRSDVPQVLKAADVVVMSSHWEGLSLSNIEGMSSGRPFVASDVDGLREVTKGYGVLFPHEDAEALANIIRKLHDDKAYYDEVAEKCHQRAMMFDIDKMVDGYEAVYQELVRR
ncbi:MAG: glycosyltransferase, partial [Prevotella sp.]